MDLTTLKTESGKTIKDFTVPESFIKKEPELIQLIFASESMKDDERQYWFNLYSIMNEDQIGKLRDILVREKEKLAEIEAKYATKKDLDPIEAAKRAADKAGARAMKQYDIKQRELAHEAKEQSSEEDILAELENL